MINLAERIRFFVTGRPVPWSAPDIGMASNKNGGRHRFAKKNLRLTEWQAIVAAAARVAYGPREPYDGCVYLGLCFQIETVDESLWRRIIRPEITWDENQARHRKQGGLPDRTNLIKGVEDALQGIFFLNDTQVRAGSDVCVWAKEPGCWIVVGFIDSLAFSPIQGNPDGIARK